MERPQNKHLILLGIVAVLQIVGAVGLRIAGWESWFLALTPYNLCILAFAALVFHPLWDRRFLIAIVTIFLGGFLVEVAGVHTKLIFGDYAYGTVLGFRVWEVPLLIGLNWLMLVYSSAALSRFITKLVGFENSEGKAFLLALLGATLMTLLDILIEPVAVKLGFWAWAGNEIPLQNYVAWFVFSFGFHLILNRLLKKEPSTHATWVFVFQVLFFLSFQF